MLQTNFTQISTKDVGQTFKVGGFAETIRDHGGLIFIDLRSQNDILQCVIDPTHNPEVFKLAEKIHPEYVLKIEGKLQKRSDETINPSLPTGEVELEIDQLEIVSKAKTMPFDIQAEKGNLAGEDTRLKYRYLDFRRRKLKESLTARHTFILETRKWLADKGFLEVQTPIIANSSPEGARDYLIPSRLHPGKFYALPQAPQQFKQLLMVGGFNKYFQISPCFRDEDPRADRAIGDFYQIDGEIAWADEEYIYELSNGLINEVFTKITNKKLMDEKMIRISYFDAMEKYGSDKPDLRYDLTWEPVKDLFVGSGFQIFKDLAKNPLARIQALHLKDVNDKFSRKELDQIQDIGKKFGLPGIAYIQYTAEGGKSPLFKFFAEGEDKKIQDRFGTKANDLIFFVANDDRHLVFKVIDKIRQHLAKKLDLIDDNLLRYVWIEEFPFFEKDDKTGKITFGHNPFSSWQGGLEALKEAGEDPEKLLSLKARQYDIAVNGYEVLSGGARNTDPAALLAMFKVLGYTEEETRERFGHMLEAYEYGSPTHAGFAWGIPRNIMVLVGESNIREVIPFPKNGSGIDPMTNSPSAVSEKQLEELGIGLES